VWGLGIFGEVVGALGCKGFVRRIRLPGGDDHDKVDRSAVAWVIGRGYRGCEDPAESLPLQALKELH
jgi:hypothetical protein